MTGPICYDGPRVDVSALPWLSYSRYLRERHGCRVYRVAVDAGFGCPNRAGGRSDSGCTYCAAHGSRAPYLGPQDCAVDLERQVTDGVAFLRRRYNAQAFILFFQAYSNTNAPVEALKRIYDDGLALEAFRGLNVATRPDCMDEAKADLLASYMSRGLEVWCELGLQSANDETLRRIRRGHTMEDFRRAHALLRERGVRTAVHLIFGLPGEGLSQIMDTIDEVARLRPDGVKIHNLHIPEETIMAREFMAGEITVPSAPHHLQYVVDALQRLPPETVIMRLQCDTPRKALLAPRGFWAKERFGAAVAEAMRTRGLRQGGIGLGLTGRRASSTLFP
jgi:radical SAM protein (TIGR01212 family)